MTGATRYRRTNNQPSHTHTHVHLPRVSGVVATDRRLSETSAKLPPPGIAHALVPDNETRRAAPAPTARRERSGGGQKRPTRRKRKDTGPKTWDPEYRVLASCPCGLSAGASPASGRLPGGWTPGDHRPAAHLPAPLPRASCWALIALGESLWMSLVLLALASTMSLAQLPCGRLASWGNLLGAATWNRADACRFPLSLWRTRPPLP